MKSLCFCLLLIVPCLYGQHKNLASEQVTLPNLGDIEQGARAFMYQHPQLTGTSDRDDFHLLAVTPHDTGRVFVRMQRLLDGLVVYGEHVILQFEADTGKVEALTAVLNAPMNGDLQPLMDAETSLKAAVTEAALLPAESYQQGELCYVLVDEAPVLAYKTEVTYEDEEGPQRDRIFAEANSGMLLHRVPLHHYAKIVNTWDAGFGFGLPGSFSRPWGAPPVGIACVDDAHDNAGLNYDLYNLVYGRDSYDNLGAPINSTVHYGFNYNNAFWNGSRLIFGGGDGTTFSCISSDRDVLSHEYAHAINQFSANLGFTGQAGALNEGLGDVMAAGVDVFATGTISPSTWRLADQTYTPAVPNDGLRYLDDPALNGTGTDFYPLLTGNIHDDSGVASLAFYLLSQGGVHPRGRSTNVVTGLGLVTAHNIFYNTWTLLATPTTSFPTFRDLSLNYARTTYGQGSNQEYETANAWLAVGVPCSPIGFTQTRAGLSGSAGNWQHFRIQVPPNVCNFNVTISGGSGDADLYVRMGAQPTLSAYHCRPYQAGNNETCTFVPRPGVWYYSLHGYANYSGVTLTVSY